MGRGRSAVTPSRASVLAAGHAVVFSLFFSFLFLFSLFKSLISSAFNSTKGEMAADGERGAPVGRTEAPSARGPRPGPQASPVGAQQVPSDFSTVPGAGGTLQGGSGSRGHCTRSSMFASRETLRQAPGDRESPDPGFIWP